MPGQSNKKHWRHRERSFTSSESSDTDGPVHRSKAASGKNSNDDPIKDVEKTKQRRRSGEKRRRAKNVSSSNQQRKGRDLSSSSSSNSSDDVENKRAKKVVKGRRARSSSSSSPSVVSVDSKVRGMKKDGTSTHARKERKSSRPMKSRRNKGKHANRDSSQSTSDKETRPLRKNSKKHASRSTNKIVIVDVPSSGEDDKVALHKSLNFPDAQADSGGLSSKQKSGGEQLPGGDISSAIESLRELINQYTKRADNVTGVLSLPAHGSQLNEDVVSSTGSVNQVVQASGCTAATGLGSNESVNEANNSEAMSLVECPSSQILEVPNELVNEKPFTEILLGLLSCSIDSKQDAELAIHICMMLMRALFEFRMRTHPVFAHKRAAIVEIIDEVQSLQNGYYFKTSKE